MSSVHVEDPDGNLLQMRESRGEFFGFHQQGPRAGLGARPCGYRSAREVGSSLAGSAVALPALASVAYQEQRMRRLEELKAREAPV
jgi:hypothetical protein